MDKPNSPLSAECSSPDDGAINIPAAVFNHFGVDTTELAFQIQRIVRAELLTNESAMQPQGAVSIVLRSIWKPRMSVTVE